MLRIRPEQAAALATDARAQLAGKVATLLQHHVPRMRNLPWPDVVAFARKQIEAARQEGLGTHQGAALYAAAAALHGEDFLRSGVPGLDTAWGIASTGGEKAAVLRALLNTMGGRR